MQIRWAYLKRLVAGAIFGLYMAHLLYFLNPQVEITVWKLATVTAIYGLTCGVLFGSILWGFRVLRVRLFGRPDTHKTHGFGFVVLAAFVSSFIYWMHLGLLRNYLPIGAVRILSKSTNVITATAFVLLALWVFERNSDRRTSRALFLTGVVLIAISSVFLYQRRDSYRTERKEVVVATIGAVAERAPVIVVAIRNLPYDWIVTMRGEGLVPFLEEQTERSYFTRLDPFRTTSPKTLWASLATGKLPHRHRVTGRFSYRTPLNRTDPFLLLPYGVGFSAWGLIPPVERISAPVPSGEALPLWSLFERLQLQSDLVVWPGVQTAPYRAAALFNATRRFDTTGPARQAILDALSSDIGALDAITGDAALSVAALEGFSAAQRALHIYLNKLPERGSVDGDAMRSYVLELDAALATLKAKFPQYTIVICSPSAVVPPPLPANIWALATSSLRRSEPGADDGFVLITGPNAEHRENAAAARVVDVVPTVLFAAGLPVGRDMDGKILTDAFSDEMLRRSSVTAIQTYEAERVVVRGPGG